MTIHPSWEQTPYRNPDGSTRPNYQLRDPVSGTWYTTVLWANSDGSWMLAHNTEGRQTNTRIPQERALAYLADPGELLMVHLL